jgi:hypothetical protein
MKVLLLATVIAAAVAFPSAASAGVFHGVVIAKEKSRQTLVVASRSGHVRTIRTHAGARVSARVNVHARKLSDGTFRASRVARAGHARHARFRAVVVAKTRHKLVVSAGRSTFDVRMASRHRGLGRGDKVVLKVSFTKGGELDEEHVKEVGHTNTIELEGTVTALTPPTADQAGSLTLTSEDDNNQGDDDSQGDEDNGGSTSFTVVIPAGFDIGSLAIGDEVELTASVNGSTLTLVTLEDENDQGEDGGGDD